MMLKRSVLIALLLSSAGAFAPGPAGRRTSATLHADADVAASSGDAAAAAGLDGKSAKMLQLLASYRQRVGNVLVPRTHIEGSEFLGSWLDRQKKAASEGTLDPAVRGHLEDLGVFTAPGSQDLQPFELMVGLLASYRQSTGNVLVPRTYIMEGYRLGAWLDKQKRAAAAGMLDAPQKSQLDALGVFTAPPSQVTETFDLMLGLLAAYKERSNNVLVPRTYIMEGHRLGAWLDKQKQAEKGGTLGEEERSKLADMGVFSVQSPSVVAGALTAVRSEPPVSPGIGSEKKTEVVAGSLTAVPSEAPVSSGAGSEKKTDVVAGALKEAEREEVTKKPAVPSPQRPAGTGFGGKTEIVAGALKKTEREAKQIANVPAPEETEGLSVVSAASGAASDTFDMMLGLLSVWKAREGNVLVPRTHIEDGRLLGAWLDKQKIAAAQGTLDAPKRRRLEELGVFAAYSPTEVDTFEVMLDLLAVYKQRVGNTFVPKTHVESGHRLGIWLNELRKAEKYETIEASKKSKLEEAGVIFYRDRVA